MFTATFDTLQSVNKLEDAGVERKQATAFVEIIKSSQDNVKAITDESLNLSQQNLATKGDLRELDLKIDGRIKVLYWMISTALGILVAIALKLFLG